MSRWTGSESSESVGHTSIVDESTVAVDLSNDPARADKQPDVVGTAPPTAPEPRREALEVKLKTVTASPKKQEATTRREALEVQLRHSDMPNYDALHLLQR